jgi:hypothetical protein
MHHKSAFFYLKIFKVARNIVNKTEPFLRHLKRTSLPLLQSHISDKVKIFAPIFFFFFNRQCSWSFLGKVDF